MTFKQSLLIGSLISALTTNAQTPKHCGTMDLLNQQLRADPQAQKAYDNYLQYSKDFDDKYKKGAIINSRAITDTIYIPVVFHVIHNGTAVGVQENISDAQLLSQIDVLNEDFALRNNNAASIPAEFLPLAGSTKIRFCMAMLDPNGIPTTGIVRHYINKTSWDQNEIEQQIKPSTIWDRNKYLNIWSVKMGGSLQADGVLAYAQFPSFWGGAANTDGLVARHNVIGRVGTLLSGYNLGRTLTHEAGHWFGLFHIWGDDNGLCENDAQGGSDNISDTPDQGDLYFGCPNHPQTSCGSNDMFMNMMDYTNDACHSMFSKEQCAKMEDVIRTSSMRKGLLNAYSKCFFNVDISLMEVLYPTATTCSGELTPLVKVLNKGLTDVSYISFETGIDNNYSTFNWTGNIPAQSFKYIQLPLISGLSDGTHQLNINATNANGIGNDNNILNDSSSVTFQVTSTGGAFHQAPYTQDFESVFFPPDYLEIKNPNNDIVTWIQKNGIGAYGQSNSCIAIENNAYTSNPNKKKDALVIASLNLNGIGSPKLSFDYSYSKRGTRYDSLKVSYSLDCGTTWNTIWDNGGESMATTPFDTLVPFIPENDQWRTVNISLGLLKSQDIVQFKFENTTYWGNILYLDNININSDPNSIKEVQQKINVSLFPNPSSGFVSVKLPADHKFETIVVTDNLGRKITEHKIIDPLSIINLSDFSEGVYLINLISPSFRQTEKLVLVQQC